MCLPTQSDIVGFFKTTELFFMFYFLIVALCLANPRKALEIKIRIANKMLKIHGFQGQVSITQQAVNRFRRDKWILFMLLLLLIALIQRI